MIKADKYFIDNLRNVLDYGNIDFGARPRYDDGKEANSLFVTQVFEEYDISKGEYPISTLRNTAVKIGVQEIRWIYQYQTNKLSVAHELGVHWWDKFSVNEDTIGNRYGYTVKKYDLVNKLLDGLKNNPFGRRHIMSLWQEEDLRSSDGLMPCAFQTLWSCRKLHGDMYLDMTLNQRSSDYITAGSINKIQYVALQMMVASHLGYKVGKFCHFVQNLHIYDRHIDAAREILDRTPIESQPIIDLPIKKKFYDITLEDFVIRRPKIEKLVSSIELAV